MAFSLLRHSPAGRQDGSADRLLAALEAAAHSVGAGLGARPEALRDIVDALATGAPLPQLRRGGRRPADGLQAGLEALRSEVFSVEAHPRESRLLWRDALATAWISAALARLAGGSPGTAGLAGLLHRVGDALALRAATEVESAEGAAFDPASLQAACAALEPSLTAALLKAWRLPSGVAAAVQGWRRVGESGSVSADARAVHYGHAFASQVLFAEFPSPGLADQLGSDLRLDRRETARLRESLGPLKAAVDSQLP
jgi:HDOD domain